MNIADASGAYLEALAQFQQWQAEFEVEWNRPTIIAKLGQVWQSQPPEVHAFIKARNPEAYRKVEQVLGPAGGTK